MRDEYNSNSAAAALHKRKKFVKELTSGEKEYSELGDALGVSLSTVRRAAKLLEAEGLASLSRGTVSLTVAGRVALQSYQRLEGSLREIDKVTDKLALLPAVLDERLLIDARFVERSPLKRLAEMVKSSDLYRSIMGVKRWELLPVYEELSQRDVEVQLLLSEDVTGSSADGFSEKVEEATREECFDMHTMDESFPTAVHMVVNGGAHRIITECCGGSGRVQCLGLSRSPGAREAFMEMFNGYRENAIYSR